MDILKVQGVGRVSGEYECDVAGLVDTTSDEALTIREAEFVREFSGARGGEIVEAFLAGDVLVHSALAMVILKRKGVPLLESTVMDLKSGWATFDPGAAEAAEEDTTDPPTMEVSKTSQNGGTNGESVWVSPEDDPSLIGAPA